MKLATLATLSLAGAAGFAAARALMAQRELPEQLPPAARERLQSLQAHLVRARAGAALVLADVDRTVAAAEQEFTADYRRRQGRSIDPATAQEQ